MHTESERDSEVQRRKNKVKKQEEKEEVREGQAAPLSRTSFPSIGKDYPSSNFEF